jgi:hypothetical protein
LEKREKSEAREASGGEWSYELVMVLLYSPGEVQYEDVSVREDFVTNENKNKRAMKQKPWYRGTN